MSDSDTVSSEAAAGGFVGYEPETPFMQDGVGKTGVTATPESPGSAAPSYETESPFLREYVQDGEAGAPGPQAELYASVLSELEDEDFEQAVTDLVHEAAALAEDRFGFEAGDAAQERMEAERGLREYFEPLARECEALVERMAQGIGSTDLTTMSEAELEAFLDRFTPAETALPPTLDNFLTESFLGKAKKFIKGAVKLAKKLSPVHIAMGKLMGPLQKMARPLIDRVLKFAIDKLPVAVRPIAKQLASKFLTKVPGIPGVPGEPLSGDAEVGEEAAADPSEIVSEFDARLAGYLVDGEAFERYAAVEQFAAEQTGAGADAFHVLQRRRAEFARDISELPAGEDPGPVVERFLPAILMALKAGIRIIGRPRVVKFLGDILAKLIGKYVGKDQAVTLSRSLAATGLQLVGLEAPGDTASEAGYALASTLEDTVTRVAQEAPAAAWEDQAVLEGYVREAFAQAASAHFPDSLIRTELHEAAQLSGRWVAQPAGARRGHYKKYSLVPEVMITRQMAAALKTFGGGPVLTTLRDQQGVAAGSSVTARVHLYEAVAGTTLPDIASHEKSVRGLGSSRREAWSMIHPLTPEAAGILLKEPGLGKQVDPKFLADRNVVTVGQRFYYLELREAAPRTLAGRRGVPKSPRVAQTRVAFDFPKGELRVVLFYSEAEAQALATQLRARAPIGAVLVALKAGLEGRLAAIFSGTPTRALRIVHEATPIEQFRSPVIGGVVKLIGRPLAGLVLKWLLEALRREVEQRRDQFAGQFTRAATSEADGVTVVVVFPRPSFFDQLRRVFSGKAPLTPGAVGGALFRGAFGEYTLAIRPGWARS